jgi:predicted dehydrogenase
MPFEVVATGGSYLQPNIADVTLTQLLFDNGMRAHIFVSWLHPFKEQKLVVIGSENMISYDDVNKKLLIYNQRVEIKDGCPVPLKGEGQEVEFPQDEPLRLECQHFLDRMADRQRPLTDGQSGVRVLEVLLAAQRSLITNGDPVQFPLGSV